MMVVTWWLAQATFREVFLLDRRWAVAFYCEYMLIFLRFGEQRDMLVVAKHERQQEKNGRIRCGRADGLQEW